MDDRSGDNFKIKAYSQMNDETRRYTNPRDLTISSEYKIEVYAYGLDSPSCMAFSEDGDLYVADSGITSGNPKVLRQSDDRFEIIADNFNIPITGINYLDGNIYVSHRGSITILNSHGIRQDIISGLPCNGDFSISNLAFGPDGKIYFGLGTATNSGVVGVDNQWVSKHPLLHDEPAADIVCSSQNFKTNNMLITKGESVFTGAFSPYGVTNAPDELKKGVLKASGSILRINRDGTDLELIAWGFRNPISIKFDKSYRLLVANRGYDVRGSRPIANAPDELHYVIPGLWYGWPDYSAGEPVTLPKFKPEGGIQPDFILEKHPGIPPKPFAVFPPHSTITGFDINYNNDFGAVGDVYIAELGSLGSMTMGRSVPYQGIGHRISKIDMNTGEVSTFISNTSGLPAYITGEGGFGRPVDLAFSPDGAMYVLDMGISSSSVREQYIPRTGVIWRVERSR